MVFTWWLCVLLCASASVVLSEQGVYVSRLTGNDTKTCGKLNSPCRTISFGIEQLSTGTYIYLDGSSTPHNPYTCKVLKPGHPGIHLTKSVSFVSIRSRAYISCFHGNPWFVDGTKIKGGIRVSFSGLTFLNTTLRFLDAIVAANDAAFTETKRVALYFEVLSLPRFELSLKNVVFQQNAACITINPKRSKTFVNITNTAFHENGKLSSNTPSILWLNSTKGNLIHIQMRTCSFTKNIFRKYGMIEVINELGTTNLIINQLKMDENNHANASIEKNDGLFLLASGRVFVRLEYGFVYKTSATFLTVTGQSAQVNISNIEVHEFNSVTPGGGVVNLVQTDSCYLSIKDSSFRNGNNHDVGGVVSMVAPNSRLTIQNSIIENITTFDSGGAVYIQSQVNVQPNRSKQFFVRLRIINSSFSYCSSRTNGGGAVCILAESLRAFVSDSSFLRNHATYGIIQVIVRPIGSTVDFFTSDVIFVQNKLRAYSRRAFGIVVILAMQSATIHVYLQRTHFFGNLAEQGGSIFLFFKKTGFHSVTLDACIFRENSGYAGTVVIFGQALLICKHSIFVSNGKVTCQKAGMLLGLNNSIVVINNTTFDSNFCGAVNIIMSGPSSMVIMANSAFLRNNNIDGAGGAVRLEFKTQTSNPSRISNAFITNVLFKENSAVTGSVFLVTNGDMRIKRCTFLNNFARFQGGQIRTLGSTRLDIYHSVFEQTVQKIFISNTGTREFISTAFLRIYSSGVLDAINTTFKTSTKSKEPLILVPAAGLTKLDNASLSVCPLGRAIEITNYYYRDDNNRIISSLTISCKDCDYNLYSLQRGTARGLNIDSFECMSCPRGADCVTAIKSKTNFWGYHASSNPRKLAFTICPFGYCKSPPANSSKYNECQGKRTGIMCGMCSQGYTEALWSTYCTEVKDCNDHWYWVLFLALVFSIAMLLVFKPPLVAYSLKQIFWFRKLSSSRTGNTLAYQDHLIRSLAVDETREESIPLSSTEQLKQNKRQSSRFVEIIFYFYQIAQLILSSSSLTEYFDTQFLAPVLGFFNFQPSFKKRGFLCPFPGLTPETKLAFKIAPVVGTLVAIFLIYALHSFICRMRGALCPAITPYLQACIKTIFLSYVTLATVSISLIRCVSVAGKARWFYNGNITCYQRWQYASIIFNAVFVIPFIFVLALVSFKLHHHKITSRQFLLAIICPLPFLLLWLFRLVCPSVAVNIEENQNLNALRDMILGPYRQPSGGSKRGALYWQSVLIARRFILVLIFCVVTEQSIRLFSMTLACVLILCFHLKVKPFQNSLANNLESLSLLSLVILGLINLFKSVFVGDEENIKGSYVTLLKVFHWLEIVMLGLLPAVLLLLVCFAIISFTARVIFLCFRSFFKCLFRPCAQRWLSRDSTLLHVCDNINNE